MGSDITCTSCDTRSGQHGGSAATEFALLLLCSYNYYRGNSIGAGLVGCLGSRIAGYELSVDGRQSKLN